MSSAAVILASRRVRLAAANNNNPWRTVSYVGHRQSIRPYWYLPVSWQEFRERFQRWVEATEHRRIQVQLLRRRVWQQQIKNGNPKENDTPTSRSSKTRQRLLRSFGRNQAQWNSWVQRKKQSALASAASLPMPNTVSRDKIRARYQGWKARRKDQYQGWKARRKEQYQFWKARRKEQFQGWKTRRREQYQGWKTHQQQVFQKGWEEIIRTKQISLQEYSKPEWFDSLGRPLTARDSTGRFVNPWQSQSTNGVISLENIMKWKLQRIYRNFKQWGLWGYVIPKLSWNSVPPELPVPSPPLPAPSDTNVQFTWLGHATCYLQMPNGMSVLVDPMFSVRSG